MAAKYWTKQSIIVTVEGPKGNTCTTVDKPFARVGAHPDCEVVLDGDIDLAALYLHATDDGIYFVRLSPIDMGASQGGWLDEGDFVNIAATYRISARLANTDGGRPQLDLLEKSKKPPFPVCQVFIDGHKPTNNRLRRRLTVVGRRKPSNLRIRTEFLSATHAVFYQDDDECMWVIDLCSRNGTWLGKQRTAVARLDVGEDIRLGKVVFRYQRLSEGKYNGRKTHDPVDEDESALLALDDLFADEALSGELSGNHSAELAAADESVSDGSSVANEASVNDVSVESEETIALREEVAVAAAKLKSAERKIAAQQAELEDAKQAWSEQHQAVGPERDAQEGQAERDAILDEQRQMLERRDRELQQRGADVERGAAENKKQLAILEGQLAELVQQRAAFEDFQKEVEKRCQQQEAEVAQRAAGLGELERSLDEAGKRVEGLRRDVESRQQEFDERARTLGEREKILARQAEELEMRQQTVEQERLEQERLVESLESQQEQLAQQQSVLDEALADFEIQRESFTDFEEKRSEFKNDVALFESDRSTWEKERAEIERGQREIAENRAKLESQSSELEAAKADLNSRDEQLRNERADWELRCADSEDGQKLRQEQLADRQRQLDELTQHCRDLEQQCQALEGERSDVSQSESALKDRVKELEDQLAEQQLAGEKAAVEMESAARNFDEHATQLSELAAEKARLEAERAGILESNRTVQESESLLRSQIDELQQAQTEQKSFTEMLESEFAEERQALTAQVRDASEKVRLDEQRANQVAARTESLEAELAEARRENESLDRERQDWRQRAEAHELGERDYAMVLADRSSELAERTSAFAAEVAEWKQQQSAREAKQEERAQEELQKLETQRRELHLELEQHSKYAAEWEEHRVRQAREMADERGQIEQQENSLAEGCRLLEEERAELQRWAEELEQLRVQLDTEQRQVAESRLAVEAREADQTVAAEQLRVQLSQETDEAKSRAAARQQEAERMAAELAETQRAADAQLEQLRERQAAMLDKEEALTVEMSEFRRTVEKQLADLQHREFVLMEREMQTAEELAESRRKLEETMSLAAEHSAYWTSTSGRMAENVERPAESVSQDATVDPAASVASGLAWASTDVALGMDWGNASNGSEIAEADAGDLPDATSQPEAPQAVKLSEDGSPMDQPGIGDRDKPVATESEEPQKHDQQTDGEDDSQASVAQVPKSASVRLDPEATEGVHPYRPLSSEIEAMWEDQEPMPSSGRLELAPVGAAPYADVDAEDEQSEPYGRIVDRLVHIDQDRRRRRWTIAVMYLGLPLALFSVTAFVVLRFMQFGPAPTWLQ